jgi:hypothetical protein
MMNNSICYNGRDHQNSIFSTVTQEINLFQNENLRKSRGFIKSRNNNANYSNDFMN